MRSLIALFPLFLFTVALTHGGEQTKEPKNPGYSIRQRIDPNGINKFYMGRQIARVMSHQGAYWLERKTREKEERPSLLYKGLQLKKGMHIADIGAGSGYHTFRLASIVGSEGKIYAVDIQEKMLELIRARMKAGNVKNVMPIKGKITDPMLPEGKLDLILMVDVYHEFSHPFEMTRALIKALKPGSGRLVFVEFRLEDPKVPIKLVHKMSQKQVLKEMSIHPDMRYVRTLTNLPWQHVVIFERKKD